MRYALCLLFAAATTLAGCASLKTALGLYDAPAVSDAAAIENHWWERFNDPLLNALAGEIIHQNLDIRIAQARVAEARGALKISQAALFPDIAATGDATRGNRQIGFPKPASIAQSGFDASWEIDLFGQTRYAANAAEARVAAQTARAEDVANSVIAELARAVVTFRQAEATLSETQALLATQDDQVALLNIRAEAGLMETTFLTRAEAERAQTATQIPLALAAKDAAQFQIEKLAGVEPGAFAARLAAHPASLTVPDAPETMDIPLSIIRNRPDVTAARAEMLATDAELASAEAALWPSLTLGGFFGAQDGSSGVPLAGNPVWSLAAGITAPLLNFGRLRGAVDAANARAAQAQLHYENTVLAAVQEAKTATSDYLNGVNALHEQQRALDFRQDTITLANERFQIGLTDMTTLTTAQSELNQATLLFINRKSATAIAFIRLQKALGVGARND